MNTTPTTTAPHFNRTFPKVLITHLGNGWERKKYLVPYSGNLTEDKFKALAGKLISKLLGENVSVAECDVERIAGRLKNTWFTGREQDVKLEVSQHGTIGVSGSGFMSWGLPPSEVVVVE